ncbi:MAG: hypothetical protein WBG73_23995 [Coleofasciculaceae cyanobacterium]
MLKTATSGQTCTLPSALLELFAEIIQKGEMTIDHRYRLRSAILNNNLTNEEKDSINRLFYSIRRGLITLVY